MERPGYYFNARLCKLARLQEGEKLPNRVGAWEFIADEHEMTSSLLCLVPVGSELLLLAAAADELSAHELPQRGSGRAANVFHA